MTRNAAGVPRTASRVDEAKKEQLAVAAILRGHSYTQAAAVAGYSDRGAAHKAVMRVLARTARDLHEKADELRALEVARLDRALVEITAVAFNTATDPNTRIKYLEALNRNVRSRATILGLNAPIQHEVITHDALDREIAQLAAQLGLDPNVIDAEVVAGPIGIISAGPVAAAKDDGPEGVAPQGG